MLAAWLAHRRRHASRAGEPLALLMLDLDHFKSVNDTYGHEAGDQVLGSVGEAIRVSIRLADLAGRFGGEEFLVLLPSTPADAAMRVAEKIRTEIAQVHLPNGPPKITASIGVAVFPEHAVDTAGVVRMADRALYEAKRRGRDRVVLATSALAPAPYES